MFYTICEILFELFRSLSQHRAPHTVHCTLCISHRALHSIHFTWFFVYAMTHAATWIAQHVHAAPCTSHRASHCYVTVTWFYALRNSCSSHRAFHTVHFTPCISLLHHYHMILYTQWYMQCMLTH